MWPISSQWKQMSCRSSCMHLISSIHLNFQRRCLDRVIFTLSLVNWPLLALIVSISNTHHAFFPTLSENSLKYSMLILNIWIPAFKIREGLHLRWNLESISSPMSQGSCVIIFTIRKLNYTIMNPKSRAIQ